MFISFLGLLKPRPLSQPPGQLYKPRGCFKDSSRTAMGRMLAGSRLRKGRDAVMACFHLAARRRYRAFGIQNGGECFSGPLTPRTYNRYDPSNRCKNGKGGSWASNVYFINKRSKLRRKVQLQRKISVRSQQATFKYTIIVSVENGKSVCAKFWRDKQRIIWYF